MAKSGPMVFCLRPLIFCVVDIAPSDGAVRIPKSAVTTKLSNADLSESCMAGLWFIQFAANPLVLNLCKAQPERTGTAKKRTAANASSDQ